MEKQEPKNQRNKHRHETDESLTVERAKTNESISKARDRSEKQTDSNVQSERGEADKKTSDARKAADSQNLKSDANKDVQKERVNSDKKIQIERAKADAAIAKEREKVKESTIEFLKQERGQTDKNLKAERAESDLFENSNIKNLSNEVKAHLQTKVSITSRDELIAILSHDLRNPLGAISTAADLMLGESDENELKRWIDIIKRNAETSLRLIEDIFEMENIAAGKFDLHLKKHDLNRILRETVDSFSAAAKEKDISLKFEPSKETAELYFDDGRILQVVSNLLGNALKFTPQKGSVSLTLTLTADEAVVSVRDNGPGIAPDKQELIFDRFSQISSKERKGLGLGLYISKIFVMAHEGRIWVDSIQGKGSNFHVGLNRHLGGK